MPRLNKSELNKLPPEKRLKRLKEIEEEDKKELKEAEKLIKKVESELKKPKLEIETPPIEEVNIDRLFEREGTLEGTVKEAAPKTEETKVKYDADAGYEFQEVKPEEPMQKIEDSKYESATHNTSKTTGTRQLLKDIKKYDKG